MQKMNLQDFKLRASSAYKLATNPRKKSETLSQTTITYLKEYATERIFGHYKDISNKYTERGIKAEDYAIEKAIQWLDLPFAIKNEERFEDNYFTGEPDLIVENTIFDIKCSWDCFTFPFFETELPNKNYFYQMQVYMHITGLKKAKVVYVLLDNEEIGHHYEIEDQKRIKVFEVDYDEKTIELLKERIEESRNFLKQL